MVTLQKFPVVLLFLIQVTNFFRQAEANVISECINYTTCSETYGDVYNSLASQRNYDNIALALYPSRKPSAVLVHVNLYAFNQTEKSSPVQYTPVQYTWSMSCLYVSFPPKVLEVLSLGSILITSRTRGLNITIPPFCCNVSKDERIVIIDRVLSEVTNKYFNSTLWGGGDTFYNRLSGVATIFRLEVCKKVLRGSRVKV